MRCPKFIRDWFTEDDAGEIWSLVHALAGGGVFVFFALAAWSVLVAGHAFDAQSYGLGFGGVMTGAGGAIFANSKADAKANK